MAFQNSCIFLFVIFSSFVSVKAVGGESGNSESTSGINLPPFSYEINKLRKVLVRINTFFTLVCGFFCNLRPLKFRCSLVIHTLSKEIEKEDGKIMRRSSSLS